MNHRDNTTGISMSSCGKHCYHNANKQQEFEDKKNWSNACRLQKVVIQTKEKFIEFCERTWIFESTDELPDRIIEVIDYGNGRMTFKEMCSIMDLEYKRRIALQSEEKSTQ